MNETSERWRAISIRQPWAGLIVRGRKTIEMRTWSTKLRGPILIHAAKLPDERPEAWAWVQDPQTSESCEYRGGIIGVADLVDCKPYRHEAEFHKDQNRHLNAPEWFLPPVLYGFVLHNVRPLPYTPFKGQTLFFSVKGFTLP